MYISMYNFLKLQFKIKSDESADIVKQPVVNTYNNDWSFLKHWHVMQELSNWMIISVYIKSVRADSFPVFRFHLLLNYIPSFDLLDTM